MFQLLAIAFAVALVAGLTAGGTMRNLRHVPLRWAPVAFASVVVALVPLAVEMGDGPTLALQIVSNLGILAFGVANLVASRGGVRAGFAVIAAGWALNFAVIAANGSMPLSEWAYARSGQTDPITEGEGGFYKIGVAGDGTLLRPLGDVIPIPGIHQVVSIGDVLLISGIAVVIAAGMRASEPGPVGSDA